MFCRQGVYRSEHYDASGRGKSGLETLDFALSIFLDDECTREFFIILRFEIPLVQFFVLVIW